MHELLLSLFIQGLYETYVKHLNTQTHPQVPHSTIKYQPEPKT